MLAFMVDWGGHEAITALEFPAFCPEYADMKEIQNKTSQPIRIKLRGGKTLHLGPAQIAQVADNATENPALQKLVADGSVEILGAGQRSTGTRGQGGARKQKHGGMKSFRRGQGDR